MQHARDTKNGNYPLHIAAQNEFTELCQLLLTAKHDPNKQNLGGQTSLHMAIGYGCTGVADLLVKNGADLTIENELGERMWMDGCMYLKVHLCMAARW